MMELKLPNGYKQIGNVIYYVGEFNYVDRIYETLIDSKGNGHRVQIDYISVFTKINENDYIKKSFQNSIYYKIQINNIIFESNTIIFQLKLEDYIITSSKDFWPSKYQFVNRILDDNIDYSQYWVNHNYLLDGDYYFPIYETNFGSGNNKTVSETKVDDSLFFNYEDREKALSLINRRAKEKLINLGYLTMNDKQILKFMTKRFDEYIKLKRTNPSLFN